MRWVVPCFLLAAASVEAQSVSGSIAGVVTDPRGAVWIGATPAIDAPAVGPR
jgi:hypothetical protein